MNEVASEGGEGDSRGRSTRSSRQGTVNKLRTRQAALETLRKRGRQGLNALKDSDEESTDVNGDSDVDEEEEGRCIHTLMHMCLHRYANICTHVHLYVSA